MSENSDDLLTPQQVADKLQLSPSGLRAWRARGIGPQAITLAPKVVRYRRGDVEAWLREARNR